MKLKYHYHASPAERFQLPSPVLPNGKIAWEAVEEHFGLSFCQAKRLFSPQYYPPRVSREVVADRLEAFALEHRLDHEVA